MPTTPRRTTLNAIFATCLTVLGCRAVHLLGVRTPRSSIALAICLSVLTPASRAATRSGSVALARSLALAVLGWWVRRLRDARAAPAAAPPRRRPRGRVGCPGPRSRRGLAEAPADHCLGGMPAARFGVGATSPSKLHRIPCATHLLFTGLTPAPIYAPSTYCWSSQPERDLQVFTPDNHGGVRHGEPAGHLGSNNAHSGQSDPGNRLTPVDEQPRSGIGGRVPPPRRGLLSAAWPNAVDDAASRHARD
jgi:hypothetical protein